MMFRRAARYRRWSQTATADAAAADDAALETALYAPLPHRRQAGPRPGRRELYVLLFDEYYTDLYRMGTAERWMAEASRMVFCGHQLFR